MRIGVKYKALISIILVVLSLVPFDTSAASKNVISWAAAVEKMDKSNGTLMNMADSESLARKQYEASLISKTIDPDGVSLSIMGQGFFFEYSSVLKLYMTQRKELFPEQMKYSWEMAKGSREMTRNSMITGMRGLYLGLYTSDNDLKLKQKRYDLTVTIHNQNKLKYEKGIITALELEESEYSVLSAKMAVKAAERNLENVLRSLNAFIGEDINEKYDSIIYNEKYDASRLKSLDFYVGKALETRMEVVSVKRQIELMELNKDIMERNPYSLYASDVKKTYEKLIEDIDYEKIKLEQALIEVEKNINDAYLDVVDTQKNLTSIEKKLKIQKSNLKKVKLRYEAGLISRFIYDQEQLNLEEYENSYKAALFDYNTRLMKLEFAAGIGPAY